MSLLVTILLLEEIYGIIKQLLWDLILIIYCWAFTRLPSKLECRMNSEHARSFKKGGFASLWNNHVRNITLILLKKIYKHVVVKVQLQQQKCETLQPLAVTRNGFCIKIRASRFYLADQKTFEILVRSSENIFCEIFFNADAK